MKRPSENFREWRPHTTEKSANRDGIGYGLEIYQEVFGFKKEELRNSTVMDLGSGPTERFSEDVKKLNINCTVISVNPDYSHDFWLRQEVRSDQWGGVKPDNKGSVAAIGQELPFPDGTFKFVVALNSISLYSSATNDSVAATYWTKEVFRVLQPNGKACFFHDSPMESEKKYAVDQSKLIKLLKDAGFIVSTRIINKDTHKQAVIAVKP